MQITIQEKKQNPLLKRMEITGKLKFESITPTNVKLTEALSKDLKCNSDLIVMKKIKTGFGKQEADFIAVVYESVLAKNKIEMATKHQKKKIEEEKKKTQEVKGEE